MVTFNVLLNELLEEYKSCVCLTL